MRRTKLCNEYGKLKPIVFLLSVILLIGCSSPDKQQISQDFNDIISKKAGKSVQPIIISIIPGEGDSHNVYEHVKFDIVALEDISLKEEWLSGTTLQKGQRISDGEVIMLYQKKSGSKWEMTQSYLKRVPK